MKILFIGLLYDPTKESEYLAHSSVGISVASNLYQWNTIKGLIANGVEVEVVGSVPYGIFPSLSDKLIVKEEKNQFEGIQIKQIGFINYYYIKHYAREKKIKKHISNWIKENDNDNKVVIFYDLQKPFLNIIGWLKKYDRVKTCLIVPDLAGELRNDVGATGIKAWLMRNMAGRVLKKATFSDAYVLLTEQMSDIINPNKKPYVIVDGIIDDNKRTEINVPEKRVIMYAGNLSPQYKISDLIEAFEKTKFNNLELWFCGKGNEEKNIIEASKRDDRIKYLGFVSKDKLSEIEKKVCFYINPRVNNGEYTKYSFPSKNLEYLLAGKPVIAYKLDGMSDDYDDVFIYLSEENQNAFSDVFDRLSVMDDREIYNLSLRGYNFVIEHNGKKKQADRIARLLEELFDEN